MSLLSCDIPHSTAPYSKGRYCFKMFHKVNWHSSRGSNVQWETLKPTLARRWEFCFFMLISLKDLFTHLNITDFKDIVKTFHGSYL